MSLLVERVLPVLDSWISGGRRMHFQVTPRFPFGSLVGDLAPDGSGTGLSTVFAAANHFRCTSDTAPCAAASVMRLRIPTPLHPSSGTHFRGTHRPVPKLASHSRPTPSPSIPCR